MNPFVDIVRFSPNERRYYRRSIAPSLIFIALIFVMAALIRQNRNDWPFEVLVALALSPALPMVWGMGTLLAFGMLPAVSLAYVIGKTIGRWRHG